MRGNLVISDSEPESTSITAHPAGAIRSLADPSSADIGAILRSGRPFWLDLAEVDQEVLDLLAGPFGFHPLAVEDAEHFGQRPKIDAYDDFALLVAYGLTQPGTALEVHCFYTERFVVTIHRGPIADLDTSIARLVGRQAPLPAPIMLLHRVIDALVDGYFPVLDAMDETIDALEDEILRRPTETQLGALFRLKRNLVTVRRLAAEQRDMFGNVLPGSEVLAGMTPEAERYFRDLYDHLARISLTADSYRDLLSSVLDTHLSTTSNRLNVVMKQLAIIATVFLPLSFVTGFFGQNFGWMVDHVGGAATFWALGVGTQIVVAGGLLAMFRKMGWLGGAGRT